MKRHNLHLLIPKHLHDRVRSLARREETTVTALVVEALKLLIEKRKGK